MVASVRRDTDTLTSALGHEEPSDFAVAAAASPLEAVTTVVGLGDRVGPEPALRRVPLWTRLLVSRGANTVRTRLLKMIQTK